jgi:choline monooxygenase
VAGIREDIAPTRLPELRFAREAIYDVRCNWKVYVDNFLEGYHVPHVHPELCRLYDFQAYRTEVRETYSVQIGPLADGKSAYAEGGGRALYYHVFPNFMLNVLPGRLQTNVVLPVAADRCRVVFRYYYADTASPDARHRIEADVSFSDGVQHEDIEICERVQRGIASRAYDRGRFSPEFEGAVHHFQRLLKEAYGRWLAGAA